MRKLTLTLLLVLSLASCSPTNWLKLDVLNPAEYTFPDTGKTVVLNASYLPTSIYNKANLITSISSSAKTIFDTIISTNLLNGFFSVLDESPIESLKKSEYEEIRTKDTANFLFPIAANGVQELCRQHNARYLIALEYYGFNKKDTSYFSWDCSWTTSLDISRQVIWRIYDNTGQFLHQVVDMDTMYWMSNSCTLDEMPEITDAVREVFFDGGEKFGKHISPSWKSVTRSYFLISRNGNDISLDRDELMILRSGKKKIPAFKACCNLAVLSESEDKLTEALGFLEEAKTIKQSDFADLYTNKLKSRITSRDKLDMQIGFK